MNKVEFLEFYDNVVKKLGLRFENEYVQFCFSDKPNALYEEYLNQKTILRILYEKQGGAEKQLLDRHKVCSCMLVSLIKVRLLSGDVKSDDTFQLSLASRVNEQFAFMCVWELFLGFVRLHKEEKEKNYELPETYHNTSFLDTITRSLFFANQLNSLSTPLIANIFFLLEKYCESENDRMKLLNELES